MLSYWEQQSLLHYDHIVIGAGIVGLSLAIELAERFPKQRILVLERGLLPTGASTRNAGFACMGSASELLEDLETMHEDEMLGLFERRKKGLEILRTRLGDDKIGYRTNGSYELLNGEELHVLDKLAYLNKLLLPITGIPAFNPADEKISKFGLSQDFTKALIENTCEGELNTGMMMRALTDLALSKHVEIKTGANVTGFEEAKNGTTVIIEDAMRREELRLEGKTLSICTNAFTKKLLPDEDLVPGRGQVLVTKPIKDLKLKGIFHFDRGYYYFREIDGRILLGGGRNLDVKGEETTEFSLNEAIQKDLENKLSAIILPYAEPEIAFRWSGIMAFGNDKQPIVKQVSGRIYGAFRMGGMGVALGSGVAKELAAMIEKGI